jgi:cold shock protein
MLKATDLRKTGTITRLFEDRVYGFIRCPLDARDYFFHQAQLANCSFQQLAAGDVVTFTVGQGPKGVQAEEVRFEHHDAPGDGPSTYTKTRPKIRRDR